MKRSDAAPAGKEKEKEYKELMALIRATDADKPSAAAKLREFIAGRSYLTRAVDMGTTVEGLLIDKVTGGKPSSLEFACAGIDDRKKNLGYGEAGELERMLIDRMVMCWLRLLLAESHCLEIGRKITDLKNCEFVERTLTRANSRFVKAVDALDRYRLMTQATRYAKAKADLIEARATAAKMKARRDEEPQQPAALALVKETA